MSASLSRLSGRCEQPQDFDLGEVVELAPVRRRVKAGEHIYHAGDPFASIYLVRSGFFKTTMTLEDGREQVTAFYMTKEAMGLDGIHRGEHGCDAIALEDSEVCVISFARLQSLSAKVFGLQHHIHRMLGREITNDHHLMLLLGSMSADERLTAFLLNLSARYASLGYSSSIFNLRMTRDDIGSFLGLKLETVSRALSKLQKMGLIQVRGKHIEISGLAELRSVADGSFRRSTACVVHAEAMCA